MFIDTPFIPYVGNTHSSMFSVFGSHWVPENTKPGNATRKTINSLYLDKNTWNWAKTLPHLPIAFIDTPFLPYVGVIHTIACFRSSAPTGFQKTQNQERDPKNNKTHCISIKTHGTGLKHYHTSQSYILIPLFYPVG